MGWVHLSICHIIMHTQTYHTHHSLQLHRETEVPALSSVLNWGCSSPISHHQWLSAKAPWSMLSCEEVWLQGSPTADNWNILKCYMVQALTLQLNMPSHHLIPAPFDWFIISLDAAYLLLQLLWSSWIATVQTYMRRVHRVHIRVWIGNAYRLHRHHISPCHMHNSLWIINTHAQICSRERAREREREREPWKIHT